MPRQYDKKMKNEVAHLICVERKSTIKTAEEYKVPLKTVEKWVTAFNKNNKVFEENADWFTAFFLNFEFCDFLFFILFFFK